MPLVSAWIPAYLIRLLLFLSSPSLCCRAPPVGNQALFVYKVKSDWLHSQGFDRRFDFLICITFYFFFVHIFCGENDASRKKNRNGGWVVMSERRKKNKKQRKWKWEKFSVTFSVCSFKRSSSRVMATVMITEHRKTKEREIKVRFWLQNECKWGRARDGKDEEGKGTQLTKISAHVHWNNF